MNDNFFVTNCDIIINADLSKISAYHKIGNYDLTIVAATKQHVVPYGTCEIDENGNFSMINEKPSFDFLINTGLYILNSSLLSLIPENKHYDMTDLIKDAKLNKNKIGIFPIENNDWIDIGQWNEYKNYMNKIFPDM